MGSGSSKSKDVGAKPRESVPQPVTVANVNNTVASVEISKTVNTKDTEKESTSPSDVLSPKKESNLGNSREEKVPSKSGKSTVSRSGKSATRLEWDSDSNLDDDDWDDFLGTTTRTTERPSKTNQGEKVRDLNSYNEDIKPVEHYPETYAQKHTRQQYTFGQDRLIREKTIYRNPAEWGASSEEEDVKPSSGFDASRFRAANQGQSNRDKEIFSARDEFETPQYLKTNDPVKPEPVFSNETTRSRQLPTYSQEEEDLMNQLIMGDEFVAHQAVNPARADVMTF